MSVFSRVGMRGTNDYPVYPGVANHVYWIGVSDDAFDWLALVVDGPLCLVLDTVLLPVDVVWQIVKPSDRDAAGN